MNNTSKARRGGLMIVAATACAGLLGCSKVNQENYDKLKVGMGYDEVTAILGEPESCESLISFKSCTWGKDSKTITIRLVADKVILFEGKGL